MQQRDIIKDQIEQLGRVLGKIIATYFELKTQGNVSEAIKITNKELQTQLDLDINRFVKLEANEMVEYLESKKLNENHLDQLSNYLFELGMHFKDINNENSLKWLNTVKILLEFVEKNSNTITFERLKLKEKIEIELQ